MGLGGGYSNNNKEDNPEKQRHFGGNKMDSLLEDACVSHFDGSDKVNDKRKAWPLVCEDAS